MIKNYLKIAWRSFSKDRVYTVINLAGLAAGLASVLLIIAYVRYELSFDRYYSHADRIYRIVAEKSKNGTTESSVSLPSPLAGTLEDEFPEIASCTMIRHADQDFQVNGENIKLETIEAGAGFFDVFNLPFANGSPKEALREDNNIVITEHAAKTYFPGQNPIGKTLKSKSFSGKSALYPITAVIKDIPGNTHFSADAIISRIPKPEHLDWHGYSAVPQYILLQQNASIQSLEKKIVSIYDKYNFPKKELSLDFQPVTAIHLHSKIPNEPFTNSDIKYVYIFSLAALLILVIGCINYINLTTARSIQRVREVGVRKVIGAEKSQLSFQFIAESVLFFMGTLPVAFLLADMLWPVFSRLVGIQAGNSYLLDWQFILAILGAGFLTGALSGMYPAFFLSSLPTAHILKGDQRSFRINLNLRRGLIVFQFMISVVLIISTAVIYMELHLLNNMELGFDKNNLIVLPWHNYHHDVEAFKDRLRQNSHIENASVASWNAGDYYGGTSSQDNPLDTTRELDFAFVDADFDFLQTLQVPLVQGRAFSEKYSADLLSQDSIFRLLGSKKLNAADLFALKPIILTRQTVQALQLKEPVLGQSIHMSALQGTVVGVSANFLGTSLLQAPPLVVLSGDDKLGAGFCYIRIKAGDTHQTIDYIQSTWNKFFPDSRFDFSFVDDRLQHAYDAQTRLSTLFNGFAFLAILIASLGLFSLVALTVRQKTKEIGIRKVLGAGLPEIVGLLSADFMQLVLVGIVIAIPLAWWGMHQWLEDFNYRITISWWVFFLTAAGCLLFAWAAVLVQTLKAAGTSPINSIRTE